MAEDEGSESGDLPSGSEEEEEEERDADEAARDVADEIRSVDEAARDADDEPRNAAEGARDVAAEGVRDVAEDVRGVDDEVGLSDRAWWDAAEEHEHLDPPGPHPDDERWHERDVGSDGVTPGPDVGDRDAADGWLASLDRAQQLALFGAAGLLVLLGLLAATYVLVLSGASGPQADPPQASFGSTYDADAGVVTVTHAGGEAVATDRLVVIVDGEPHDDWTATGESLSTGDELRVRSVAPDASGRLQWRDPADDVEVPLVEFGASE